MSKPTLNKRALQNEREQLRLYRGVLPSLELKRQQLTMELNKARRELDQRRSAAAALQSAVIDQIPMLANHDIDLAGFVRIASVELTEENLVGVRLPRLVHVHFDIRDYSMLGKPAWVDLLLARLQEILSAQTAIQVLAERVARLQRAYRRITQRVNLFEKMLIPEALANIRRIKIFLSDAERAAVVRSKMMKARHDDDDARLPVEELAP